MDWASLFPTFFPPDAPPGTPPARVEFADVGCGYGGLLGEHGGHGGVGGGWGLPGEGGGPGGAEEVPGVSPAVPAVALAERFPQTLALGLELRGKVAAFTRARIRALRAAQPGRFGNVACVRGNAMKHLPHFFRRAQVSPETPQTHNASPPLPEIPVSSDPALRPPPHPWEPMKHLPPSFPWDPLKCLPQRLPGDTPEPPGPLWVPPALPEPQKNPSTHPQPPPVHIPAAPSPRSVPFPRPSLHSAVGFGGFW